MCALHVRDMCTFCACRCLISAGFEWEHWDLVIIHDGVDQSLYGGSVMWPFYWQSALLKTTKTSQGYKKKHIDMQGNLHQNKR